MADCAYGWSPTSVDFSQNLDDFSPNRHRETRFIEIAVRELWRFSLWFLKSRRFQFQNEQWAFRNWNRLDFKIIMIAAWPIDTVNQDSLDKQRANSDDFHNVFSLRKIDTVKHGVVDFHYENRHRETRPLYRETVTCGVVSFCIGKAYKNKLLKCML